MPGFPKAIPNMFFEFPFEYADVEGLGRLFYPIVTVGLKTIDGWREFEFLVDTGADVTTVPSHLLPVLGFQKDCLTVSKTLGVGGISTKTWEFKTYVKIGRIELLIHCNAVDSKNNSMPLLLGKKDVFEERFNLLLDSRKKVTVLSENSQGVGKCYIL